MMKKRAAAALISLILLGNTAAFAEAPNGTVVIGDKAYTLKYVNSKENLKEMREAIRNKNGEIFVKNKLGVWYRNSGVQLKEKVHIPGFVYKTGEGEVFQYGKHDGDRIILKIEEAKMISKTEIEIKFSGEIFESVAKDRENYLIFGEKLGAEDIIIILKDGKTVRITLKKEIDTDKKLEVAVSKNVTFSMEKDEGKTNKIIVDALKKSVAPYYGGGGSVTPKNTAPEVSNVNVTGEAIVEGQLKVEYDYTDKENDKQGESEIKWYRASSSNGADKVLIQSQDEATYTLTKEDIGEYIFAEVTPVAKTGEKEGTAVLSGSIGPIKDKEIPVENTAPEVSNVNVTGEAIVEGQLKVEYDYTDKENDKQGESEIKWYRASSSNGADKMLIQSNGDMVYTIKKADIGEYIFAEVTPVAKTGEKEGAAVLSGAVGPIKNKDTQTEYGFNVAVEGYNYSITLSDEGLTGRISMRVVDKVSGHIVDNDLRIAENNKVTFERRLERAGEYTVVIKANGKEYRKDFEIIEESQDEDVVKPIITLIGEKNVNLNIGDIYSEMGARATDNLDGDITDKISMKIINSNGETVSEVDTSKAGTFVIYYMVEDAAGNEANMIQRNIRIESVVDDTPVNVEVIGHEVKITLKGQNLKRSVTITIFNKETGRQVDAQTRLSSDNEVVFNTYIDDAGEYIINMNAFRGEDKIQRNIIIK